MRLVPDTCPFCDASLTRVAVLMLRLKKSIMQIHSDANHKGDWNACELQPCADARRDMALSTLPRVR